MGTKANKAMIRKSKKESCKSWYKKETADFLPLEGGPGRELPDQDPPKNTGTVLYIGRIPHGFYENEMEVITANLVGNPANGMQIVYSFRWKGVNRLYKPLDMVQFERKRQNKERTLEQQKKMMERIGKPDQKQRMRIEAAGLDYECPKIVGQSRPASKKIRFEDDEL